VVVASSLGVREAGLPSCWRTADVGRFSAVNSANDWLTLNAVFGGSSSRDLTAHSTCSSLMRASPKRKLD
jgi:hypothetical protein